MVKSIILSLTLFLFSNSLYSSVRFNQKQYLDSAALKREVAVEIAQSFHGIKEIGKNEGFDNKKFEQAMKNIGWAPRQAWCSYVLKLIYTLADVKTTITGWSPSSYNKKNVVYTKGVLYKKPLPADAVSFTYPKFLTDKSRYKGIGHTGLLIEYGNDYLKTAEGNTSDLSIQVVRDGDVFTAKKIRPINTNTHITRWIE